MPTTTTRRCAYESPSTGRCMNMFPAKGKKKFCSDLHKVKAHQQTKGRDREWKAVKAAALARDGGRCTMECKGADPCAHDEDHCVNRCHYRHSEAWNPFSKNQDKKQIFVRIIDASKPRTLDNVQTLCAKHYGSVSDTKFRARVGDEAYKARKRQQFHQFQGYAALRGELNRTLRQPRDDNDPDKRYRKQK